jgi:hypothetical protein
MRAIVNGERDPEKLAQLRDRRCQKGEEEIAEQLRGHWREDHPFSLKQALTMYDAVQERIAAYDAEILRRLGSMERASVAGNALPPVKNPSKAKAIRKRGEEPMREALYRLSGVDLTFIDAIGVETVQVVLSEYGPDLSRFDTEHHFVSHLNLSPTNEPVTDRNFVVVIWLWFPGVRWNLIQSCARDQAKIFANIGSYAHSWNGVPLDRR